MTVSTGDERSEERASGRGTIPVDTFSVRLVLARIHAGDLTLRDAAERCGLSFASWSNWERGMKPRDLLEVAQAVSEGLGIDRDWLLFGGPLTPEKRHRDVRRRNRLSYPRPARLATQPINRGGALAIRRRLAMIGPRAVHRKIDNRPPGHATIPLRRAA